MLSQMKGLITARYLTERAVIEILIATHAEFKIAIAALLPFGKEIRSK